MNKMPATSGVGDTDRARSARPMRRPMLVSPFFVVHGTKPTTMQTGVWAMRQELSEERARKHLADARVLVDGEVDGTGTMRTWSSTLPAILPGPRATTYRF